MHEVNLVIADNERKLVKKPDLFEEVLNLVRVVEVLSLQMFSTSWIWPVLAVAA
jgi:hypothetical protein